jgi:hypothetical protein
VTASFLSQQPWTFAFVWREACEPGEIRILAKRMGHDLLGAENNGLASNLCGQVAECLFGSVPVLASNLEQVALAPPLNNKFSCKTEKTTGKILSEILFDGISYSKPTI